MSWRVDQLNDRILRMMSPEDRKKFGKAGMTAEEALRKATAKSERDLQKLIAATLALKGIVGIRSRMDKPTTNNEGTPDFLFAVKGINIDSERLSETVACAWEVKLPGGEELSEAQRKMAARMIEPPNAWRWALITSVDDALEELRALGIK